MFRRCAVVLFLAASFGAAAHATLVQWTLSNVNFSDGGTATGSFVYDADTNTYTNWSISVAGGSMSATFPAFTYNAGDSSASVFTHTSSHAVFSDPSQLSDPSNPLTQRLIGLWTNSPMTNAGGTVTLTNQSSECFNCGPFRTASGSLVGAATGPSTPEPGSASLFVLGLGCTALGLRRVGLK